MAKTDAEVIKKIYEATNFTSTWYGVPVERVRSHCWEESRWCNLGVDPNILSPSGHGKGCMQIDDRFHDFALSSAVFDILMNISFGTRFLSILYQTHSQNWTYASQAYNGSGEAAVEYAAKIEQWIKEEPWLPICREAGLSV